MEDNPRPDDIDADFAPQAELSDGYELGVAWRPKYDRPVTILIIRVNGHRIASSTTDDSSPFIVSNIPRPDGEGAYTVAWAISPEVPVDHMWLAIRNRTTGATRMVGKTGSLARGQLWQNTGVKVNAP